jgi:hypothetical protein
MLEIRGIAWDGRISPRVCGERLNVIPAGATGNLSCQQSEDAGFVELLAAIGPFLEATGLSLV